LKTRLIFVLSLIGVIGALASAYIFGIEQKPQPPVFSPPPNPYRNGIYANGIVESDQPSGENINIYPEVAGRVTRILVREGERVTAGAVLAMLDDSVQKATVEQQRSQSEAALAALQQIRSQPRPEVLSVTRAQLDLAGANLKMAQDQFSKQRHSFEIEPRSVSRDALDTAENTLKIAQANLEVAQRQYELTSAGAWVYDINSQEKQYDAALKAYQAANALRAKYTLRAPADGVVLSINATVGGYVSAQGSYDSYTQGFNPALVMGTPQDHLAVRCYVDEILVNRLPPPDHLAAQMIVRGTDVSIPLEFVRLQPYLSPKIQLSDQRQERVDLRVLPVIFRFPRTAGVNIYPGQLVDVYVGSR